MKFCPACKTRYDEEILRFCPKDGTPLIEEGEPQFKELPSESAGKRVIEENDFEEETIIRQKTPPLNPPDFKLTENEKDEEMEDPSRIVIPMSATAERPVQQVRPKTAVVYQEVQPKKSNTPMIVLTTVLLTLVVLGGMGALFWALRGDSGGTNVNVNVNTNPPADMNINTNLNNPLANFDYNSINANLNTNIEIPNLNINTAPVNVNLKTPTPSRTPTPLPTATPDESTNSNSETNNNRTSPTPAATRTPPASTPTPIRTPPPNPPPAATTTPPPANNTSSVSDILKNGRKKLPKLERVIRENIQNVKLPKR